MVLISTILSCHNMKSKIVPYTLMILPWLTSKQKAITNHYTRSVNFAGYAKATGCIHITNFKNQSPGIGGWGREGTLPHPGSAGAGDGTCPVDPGQQDLSNMEITKRSSSEGPVLIAQQKPETSNLTNDSAVNSCK